MFQRSFDCLKMANIHDSDDDSDDDSFDEQQGGINFYPELNNIHDIRDNIGGEEEDNIGDNIRDNIHDNNIPPAYPDIYIPDILNDLQSENRNAVGIMPMRSVETAPIVVPNYLDDEYIIGNRIIFYALTMGNH